MLDRSRVPIALVVLAAAVGLFLVGHAATVSSATYDEPTYLRIASRWWRTGDASEISRMGSPVTFWKIQQAPVFWMLDRTGRSEWVDDPIAHQAELLPIVRLGSLWIWLAAFGATCAWAGDRHGPRAAASAAWIFALSPNLIAHGGLATMETPLVAATAGLLFAFDRHLATRDRRWFVAAGVLLGVAFSMKFTAVVYPPLLAAAWWLGLEPSERFRARTIRDGCLAGSILIALTVLTNLAVTGFAVIPLSEGVGDHPFLEAKFGPSVARLAERCWPVDWVGFLNQLKHQRAGGPSYLFGETRTQGWWWYYPVALAAKTPLVLWLLVAARLATRARGERGALVYVAGFLLISMLMSKRNYGVRYLLPVAPAAVVWLSAAAAESGLRRFLVVLATVGYAVALAGVHPRELSYFNRAAGGTEGGRRILSDSNLDWGQGLRDFAALQRADGRLRDVEIHYFGDTEPRFYGVVGRATVVTANDERNALPLRPTATTRHLAVSTSLVWGPWGRPGRYDLLRNLPRIAETRDGTILVYDTSTPAWEEEAGGRRVLK